MHRAAQGPGALARGRPGPEPQYLEAETPRRRDYPPRAYGLHETATVYVGDDERFVVSLIAGYSEADNVDSPVGAAAAALALTTDEGATGTHWFVSDRHTEENPPLRAARVRPQVRPLEALAGA
jgi:hypothetical protein